MVKRTFAAVVAFSVVFVLLFIICLINSIHLDLKLIYEPMVPSQVAIFPYSQMEIIQFIREIEANIFLVTPEILSSQNWSSSYSTGFSPHYYNGNYSLHKTCKHLYFNYLCLPNNIHNIVENRWTFKINESNLNQNTTVFLKILQNNSLYTNTYQQYMNNINHLKSPYIINKVKIGYFGNSFIRQIIEGYHCLIDNITNNNAQQNVIYEYHPVIQYINNKTMNYSNSHNYDELLCDAVIYNQRLKWNDRRGNGLNLNQSVLNMIKKYKLQSNIQNCRDDSLVTTFVDQSKLFYQFMHFEQNKTLYNYYTKLKEHCNDINAFNDIDILIFNPGNDPHYELSNLKDDLNKLNFTDKPIIFLTQWRMRPKINPLPKELMDKMYKEYDNLIWIDWPKKFKYFKRGYSSSLADGLHPCMPGIPDHGMLLLNNLINTLLLTINTNKR